MVWSMKTVQVHVCLTDRCLRFTSGQHTFTLIPRHLFPVRKKTFPIKIVLNFVSLQSHTSIFLKMPKPNSVKLHVKGWELDPAAVTLGLNPNLSNTDVIVQFGPAAIRESGKCFYSHRNQGKMSRAEVSAPYIILKLWRDDRYLKTDNKQTEPIQNVFARRHVPQNLLYKWKISVFFHSVTHNASTFRPVVLKIKTSA